MVEESPQVLAFLTPDQMSTLGGLSLEGVMGFVKGEALNERELEANPVFVDFMHDVVRRTGPQHPGLIAAAAA